MITGPRELRILLAADFAGGAQVLRTLLESRHEVAAVLSPERDRDFGTVAGAARKYSIPTIRGGVLRDADFADFLRDGRIDLLINALSPYRICDEVLAAPRIGAFNLHPSLLPRNGGITPASWALYNGDRYHGATLHWVTSEVDCGPIADQVRFDIEPADTPVTLLRKAFVHSAPMLKRLLGTASDDPASIQRVPQDLSLRTYYSKANHPRRPWIFWEDPADFILSYVRACDYWPFEPPEPWTYPQAEIAGHVVSVMKLEPLGDFSFVDAAGQVRYHERGLGVAAGGQHLLLTRACFEGRVLSGPQLHELLGHSERSVAAVAGEG